MLWAREILRPGQPKIVENTRHMWPRAFAWAIAPVPAGKSKYFNIHHHIDAYRAMFDNFDTRWVHWTPYTRFYRRYDEHFYRARLAGIARVPLIFFEDIEYQLPERVTRQFGMPLWLPQAPPEDMDQMRFQNENTFMKVDLRYYNKYVQMWNAFVEDGVGIIQPPENVITLETYMDWYYNITKLKIVPPSRATKDPVMFQQPRDKCDVSKALDLVCF